MQMVFCLLVALLYVGGVAADEPLALHMPDAPPLTLYHDERGTDRLFAMTFAGATWRTDYELVLERVAA